MANRTQATESQQSRKQNPTSGSARTNGGSQGASDHLYGVVSVLYHALQGAQAYEQYVADARKAEAPAIEQFFDECRKEENLRAQRAKSLLLDLLEDEEDDEEEAAGSEEDEDEDEDDE
jgi:uncharacterized short protein YbdD (DUF466 family)